MLFLLSTHARGLIITAAPGFEAEIHLRAQSLEITLRVDRQLAFPVFLCKILHILTPDSLLPFPGAPPWLDRLMTAWVVAQPPYSLSPVAMAWVDVPLPFALV